MQRPTDIADCLSNVGSATVLTDGSGGTASNALATISDAATANALASITAKVNEIISKIGGN